MMSLRGIRILPTAGSALKSFSTATSSAMSNPGNIIGGHKANLKNPNTSKESKQHSREILEAEFDGGDTHKFSDAGTQTGGAKNPHNVEGGLKATLKNPNTSEEAKQRARERLEGHDL
ncbi:hypothetical protein K440DRAFT_21985 [Wilcoxina mikolae CBS 423.85]|nr:hypothetical protein K440DRAFT_21985 [Wilcoxina mikolae CBS 423.85]